MTSTPIDSAVLGGQGGIGSRPLNVPNPAPGIGTGFAGSGADGNLSVDATGPETTTAIHAPKSANEYGAATTGTSPTGEPASLYQPGFGKAQGA